MEQSYFERERYERARKRVKRIRGFYTHALVYVVINIMIFIVNTQLTSGQNYNGWQMFSTPVFWGIGLLAHGLSVFLPPLLIGKGWEDDKIKELMEKEKNQKWE